ncbi:MAG TPA: hypothetical protein VHY10_05190 [Xanthobacteraceae bacterium]|jgi:hypothetical protein|nr:hypothetical protein [Xanthobacteraceae bacterium]
MSFSMGFTATSPRSAADQLRESQAPLGVKVLVELALAGVPWPRPTPMQGTPLADGARTSVGYRPARLVAVRVESSGHMAEGDGGRSSIDRFVVEPLFE